MSYIGNKPANKAVVASDLDPAVITGQTALAVAPADTDEFLISDAGTLKRIDASLVGGKDFASLLSAGSGTAVSEIIFDNLDVSTYSTFMIVWFSAPASDDQNLYAQIRTGGASGSTYSSSYYDSTLFGVSADNSYYSKLEGNADHWRIQNNAGNGGSTEFHCSQIFFTPRKSSYQNYFGNFIRSQGTRYDSSTNFRGEFACGAFNHSDAPIATGLRIYYASGNIEDYDYKLYGIV